MIIKAWLNGEVKIYQRKTAWVRCNVAGNKLYSISMPRSFKIKREFFPYLTIARSNNVKEKKGDSYESQEIRVAQMERGHLQRPSKCVLLTPKLKKGGFMKRCTIVIQDKKKR
jgi:hypothetical protein